MIQLVNLVFGVFELLILARVLLSWINASPYSPFVQFLHNVTEPILAPVRRLLPPTGMLDLSPVVVLIAAMVLQRIIIQLLP